MHRAGDAPRGGAPVHDVGGVATGAGRPRRGWAILAVCASLAAMTSACAEAERGVVVAATAGDFVIGGRRSVAPDANAGFLGAGSDGATGPAHFADGTVETVQLGARYFAASGRWCRSYRPVTAADEPAAAGASRVACWSGTGWQKVRAVVVTNVGDVSRS